MKGIRYYTYLCTLFLALLFLSGGAEGLLSDSLYYLAFLAPLLLAMLLHPHLRREREEIRGLREEGMKMFSLDGKALRFCWPFILPTVLVTLGISNLTGFLLGLAGLTPPDPGITTLPLDLLKSALVPSVLEELLFRAVPLMLICPYSKRGCVLVGALYFALAHASVFSFPYALAAGVVLAFLSVCTGSVIPAFAVHLVNNILSVILMHYGDSLTLCIILLSLLAVGALISVLFIVRRRGEYLEAAKECLRKNKGEELLPPAFYLFVLGTVVLTLSSFL